jgi:hypothetical protein
MGDKVWSDFFDERTKPLTSRFPGLYRAVVVETNDPLRMRRVRFKIPELHDWDLKPEDCPWAVPSTDLGTRRCGRFTYPCVGDYVWISFEKAHPYAPIYVGFANPTRRKFYPLPSLYGKTPVPVDEKSDVVEQPSDYDEDYLPKDERPMSHGWQDRYGNLDIHNATGFFPIEHTVQLPPADADQLTKSKFAQSQNSPEANNPDSKMMARISKYGMILLQADMGYKWQKVGGELDAERGAIGEREGGDDQGGGDDSGEFTGDFEEDEDFEIKRWLYMQRLLHEDESTDHDQRRIMNLTRYGHKFEMRDVGWNKTRETEWSDDKRTIGDGEDERWIKIRTKGGHLIQASDVGFDPEYDEFVKRLLVDEAKETYLDKEDQFSKKKSEWNQYGDRDMRMLRFVTRSGIKFVLDDRESHDGGQYRPPFDSAAESRLNEEIGIGVLIKGRATPGTQFTDYPKLSGNSKGYFWQFDERPDYNSTSWGTPMGQVLGMDDNEEMLVACSRLPDLVTDWKNLADNEFLENSIRSFNPAHSTHHMIIDHQNEAIRFKSRAGNGSEASTKHNAAASGEHAGIEVHDYPAAAPWMEIIDIDKRGMWFSRQDGIGIWRAKDGTDMYIWIDDSNNNIVLRNDTSGKIQIYCKGNVEIISDKIVGFKGQQINMKADSINLQAGSKNYTFGSALEMNADIKAPNVYARFPTAEKPAQVAGTGIGVASGGGKSVANLTIESLPSKVQPDDRL